MTLRHAKTIALMCGILVSFNVSALGIAIDTEDLIDRAKLIVIGKVVSKTGLEMNWFYYGDEPSVEPPKEIMTEYRIAISRILKGELSDVKLNFYGFGGVVEGRRSDWSFGFDYEPGDLLLLFLEWDEQNRVWIVNGQSQGLFKLETVNGLIQVKRLVSDALIVNGGEIPINEHQKQQTEKLEAFINKSEK